MVGKRSKRPSFIEATGAQVCRSAEVTAKAAANIVKAAAGRVKHSAAPAGQDALRFIKGAANAPVAFIKERKEHNAEERATFERRKELFGFRKAAQMRSKERKLEAKRKGKTLLSPVTDVVFPIASVGALVFCVNTIMSRDYGVAVEYDGAQVGVVSGEDVLGEAQCVVADRVKYYDIEGDYYVTAALAITPLTSSDDVIDGNALAENMEGRISLKYEEKPEEMFIPQPEEPEEEFDSSKVKAFAVRVDGELIGAVEDYASIERALNAIKKPYESDEYCEIAFDKDIEYDLEEYFDPEDIISANSVIETLTGVESEPVYYEVQPGDTLWHISEAQGIDFKELCGCYATYNGKVIEDLEHSVLRVGALIQIDSEVPYLQVECKKEMTLRNTIPFETITLPDPTLPEGKVVVDTEGQDGEKRSRALVTFRDDVPVRKRTLESVIYKEPISEIIRVGTGKSEGTINREAPEFITEGGTGDYFWPVGGGYISAHQGDGRGHKGIDIAAPYGTPIYAAASGTVIDTGTGWNGGYGNCVMIQNDDGNVTVYAHQAEIAAALGDVVEKGQLIGYVGSTGDSTGNHLHFEVRKDGKYYNPELYVSQ